MNLSEHERYEAEWHRRPVSQWPPWLLADCTRTGGVAFRPDLNVYASLAQHERVLPEWVALGQTVLEAADLTPADRERAILWTASRCGGRYPFARHVPIALAAGVTCDEIQRISSRPTQHRPPATHGVSVRPLISFFAMASFVLETLRTPPDSDVASYWPSWSRTDGRRGVGPNTTSGRDWTMDEMRAARAHFVAALVENRALPLPEWNGIVLAARRTFGRSGSTSVLLPGPADSDAEVVRVINDLCHGVRTGPPMSTPKHILEAVLVTAAAGILEA